MFGVLVLLLLVVPILELYVIVQIAGGIGTLETIGLLILVSVVGAWLVRREGVSVLNRLQLQLAQRRMPTNELVDGMLILVAGALMLTPGFLTDALGLLLLIPPTRILVRRLLIRRFRGRLQVAGAFTGSGASRPGGGPIWDVSASSDLEPDADDGEATRDDDEPHPPIELGP